jgi:hypothetical protein
MARNWSEKGAHESEIFHNKYVKAKNLWCQAERWRCHARCCCLYNPKILKRTVSSRGDVIIPDGGVCIPKSETLTLLYIT